MSEQTPFLPPFIVLEGDEGTGKSTVAKAVVAKLTEKGIPFVHTREPGGTALGEALREQLIMKRENPLDPVTHILMHQAYRKEHISNVILPALAEGKVVLCERFYYSTLALNILPYVQARPELQQLFIDTMPHVAANIPQPLTFIMDIPADKEAVRQARLAERPTKDGYESRSEEELYATSAAYKQFLGDPSIIAMDALANVDDIAERIVEQIEAQIKQAKAQAAEFDQAASQSSPEAVEFAEMAEPEPKPPFDLIKAVEDFLDEHLVAALFNHDEEQVAVHRPLARSYVLTVYEQAKDPVIFEGANRARLRTNLHSIFHFGYQLDLLREKVNAPAELPVAEPQTITV